MSGLTLGLVDAVGNKVLGKTQLVNQSSGEYEYYTDQKIIEAVRLVMRGIDLDPASNELANKRVKASRIHYAMMEFNYAEAGSDELPRLSVLDGGLNHTWIGRTWMNHPFSRSEAPCKTTGCTKKICKERGYHTDIPIPGNAAWVNKLIKDYIDGNVFEACCITYASSGEAWFKPLMNFTQCFLFPRTNYYLPNGEIKKGVTKGSVVTYLGDNQERFRMIFKDMGVVK